MADLLDPMANPVTYALPFFILSILVELAALKWLDHDDNATGYSFKDARASLLMGAGSLIFLTVFKVGTFFVYSALYTYVAPFHLPTNTWWFWVLMTVGLDLAYYGNHRFVHRTNIGWAAHQSHHSSEYMNFATALRQKWNPWFEFFFWLPLPLLGFAPWALYVAFSFNLIYQFFVHTEMIDKLWWPIELVFNTPSHHRVHHGCDPEYLDKNYAGIFIIWDRMFGTFQEELHKPTYGLTHKVETYNVFSLEYKAFADIIRLVRTTPRWRDKFGYLFRPPGWEPPRAMPPARSGEPVEV